MTVTEAITKIAKQKNGGFISLAASMVLNKKRKLEFTKLITDQCNEPGTNKQRLKKLFGTKVIETICNFKP